LETDTLAETRQIRKWKMFRLVAIAAGVSLWTASRKCHCQTASTYSNRRPIRIGQFRQNVRFYLFILAAIIGGGLAGASAAYYLNDLHEKKSHYLPPFEIDIYEENEGRLRHKWKVFRNARIYANVQSVAAPPQSPSTVTRTSAARASFTTEIAT